MTICEAKKQSSDRMTKAELMRYYMAIDRQLIREARKKKGAFRGLRGAELFEADALLTDFMKLDFTDADIDEIAALDYNDLQGLGNIFKKVATAVKKVASVVTQTVKPVVQAVIGVAKAAANVVKAVVTTPVRAVVATGLEVLKGPTAKAFLYVFVPDSAPELAKFPAVARKREKQIKAVDLIVKHLMMDRSYVMKHIRNAIVTKYNKTPEDILHDFANQKETEFSWPQATLDEGEQLGFDPTLAVAIVGSVAGLTSAVAGLAQVFKKPNLPTTADWTVLADGTKVNNKTGEVIPADRNITNDPGYDGKKPFYKTPLGISLMAGGGIALLYGGYKAVS